MKRPSLTVIGGPNGSGKTTVVRLLKSLGIDFPNYANADDIARDLTGNADVIGRTAQEMVIQRRARAFAEMQSFCYETVMSHDSHIAAMRQAREQGYFVRLIFIATDDPEINVRRVADRVAKGGHDVPRDKILSRYARTMESTLFAAICASDEALIFDNTYDSATGPIKVAHITGRFARLFPDPRIVWPDRHLFPKIRGDADFVVAPD